MASTFAALIAFAFSAEPVHAGGFASVPEPSNLTLFGLGLLGIVIGRQAARRRTRDRKED